MRPFSLRHYRDSVSIVAPSTNTGSIAGGGQVYTGTPVVFAANVYESTGLGNDKLTAVQSRLGTTVDFVVDIPPDPLNPLTPPVGAARTQITWTNGPLLPVAGRPLGPPVLMSIAGSEESGSRDANGNPVNWRTWCKIIR